MIDITNLVRINFDLLSVAIAIAGIVILGILIYRNNATSATNRTFLIFSLLTAIWGISNYLEYRFTTAIAALWALRIHLFISVWHAYYFLKLAYVFPKEIIAFGAWWKRAVIPLVIITSLLTLTPFVFSGIEKLAPVGQVTRATPAPGIALFMAVAFGFLVSALALLINKIRRSEGTGRRQNISIFIGMFMTACLLLIFNVILPNVFSNRNFIPLAALFILPFIALTSYAIHKYHLFDLKVATTAFLGFMVTVFTFVNVLYSSAVSGVVLNLTAFIIVLMGSIKITQDTLNLVRQKELILAQEQELEVANKQQESLLHFISHEIKGYLTKNEAAFASIAEGDYGPVSSDLNSMASSALKDTRKGVDTVMDILDASNLKKGTVSYERKSFNFSTAVRDIVESLEAAAKEKGISLEFNDATGGSAVMSGDENKLRHNVIRNLVDNAVRYTPSGSVKVQLLKNGATLRLAVEDTGVGISPEDMKKLFTEGGRGTDSVKINVHSTGYGLFIAKTIVEAHRGKIRAESEGKGRGSRFVVELPSD